MRMSSVIPNVTRLAPPVWGSADDIRRVFKCAVSSRFNSPLVCTNSD